MGSGPFGRLEQFIGRGIQLTEIGVVLSDALMVDGRIELEMDLIEATGEMNSQPRPVRSRLDALEEALRKTELEETRRRGIQPRVRQAEVGGYSVTGLDQGSGKRPRVAEPSPLAQRDDVDVGRRPSGEAEN